MAYCQVITQSNVDYAFVRVYDSHMRAISQRAQATILYNELENHTSKITVEYPKGHWVEPTAD